MFEKCYQEKLAVNSTTTYAMNGLLDWEKLCLELADSCLAIKRNKHPTIDKLAQAFRQAINYTVIFDNLTEVGSKFTF